MINFLVIFSLLWQITLGLESSKCPDELGCNEEEEEDTASRVTNVIREGIEKLKKFEEEMEQSFLLAARGQSYIIAWMLMGITVLVLILGTVCMYWCAKKEVHYVRVRKKREDKSPSNNNNESSKIGVRRRLVVNGARAAVDDTTQEVSQTSSSRLDNSLKAAEKEKVS